MAAPLLAPMPEMLVVQSGYTVRVTAVDPTTGALVAGVNVGMEVITGTSFSDLPGGNTEPPPPPLLAHVQA